MSFLAHSWNFVKARYAPRGARYTFSQSGEDLVMKDALKKRKIHKARYIDIGSHDPVFGNNTYLFYREGGCGVLVEPNAALAEAARRKRPHDACLNVGAGKSDGTADFYEFSQSTRSTFSKEQADAWQAQSGQKPIVSSRPIMSLDSIIAAHFERSCPDIVSIDAEGLDLEILQGFSWSCRPAVFCVEWSAGMDGFFQGRGYALHARILANAIYLDTTL